MSTILTPAKEVLVTLRFPRDLNEKRVREMAAVSRDLFSHTLKTQVKPEASFEVLHDNLVIVRDPDVIRYIETFNLAIVERIEDWTSEMEEAA